MTDSPQHQTPAAADLRAAAQALLDACVADMGYGDETGDYPDRDDEPVGHSSKGPLAVQFGHMRRLREILAASPPQAETPGLARAVAEKRAELGPIFLDIQRQRVRGIYIASKTVHAPRWRALREAGFPIISTWIDEDGKGETACFQDLWRRCVDEAASADAVIVYREPGEVLKGAFVEAGAALAVGTPVYAIGCDEFSFVNHAGVTISDHLSQALADITGQKVALEASS